MSILETAKKPLKIVDDLFKPKICREISIICRHEDTTNILTSLSKLGTYEVVSVIEREDLEKPIISLNIELRENPNGIICFVFIFFLLVCIDKLLKIM